MQNSFADVSHLQQAGTFSFPCYVQRALADCAVLRFRSIQHSLQPNSTHRTETKNKPTNKN